MSAGDPAATRLERWNREEEQAGVVPVHRSFRFGPDQDAAAGDGRPSVLLLHGAGGSPADFRDLGESLAAAGFRGECPLLPGHGADPASLAESRFHGLRERAQESFEGLASDASPAFVVAQSLGVVLAIRMSTSRKMLALVALAPALHPFVVRRIGLLIVGLIVRPRLAWKTLLWQLDLLREIRTTRDRLAEIRCPLLVLVSRDDPTVSPRGARELRDRVTSPDCEIVEFADQGHVLSAAPDRHRDVFPRILQFLERLSSPETRSRTTGPPPGGA